MRGGPVGYLHDAVEELNSGLLRTNPDSSRVEDLNQGPPHLKSSALNHLTMSPPLEFKYINFVTIVAAMNLDRKAPQNSRKGRSRQQIFVCSNNRWVHCRQDKTE